MARKRKSNDAESSVLDKLRTRGPRGRQTLTNEQREALLAMFAARTDASVAIEDLVPPGSFPARVLRHFRDTDIAYALPLMSTIMHMASLLTQRGVSLVMPSGERVRPTIWAIGLAESGSSKTLAFNEVRNILGERAGVPIRMLPNAATDAQWFVDLSECNGSFWFQDEAGQYLRAVESSKLLARMKPWILSAYSGETIGNRLKGEACKLEVDDPHFSFLGLTVRSTWTDDVDSRNMANGLCQRFNYFLAEARPDKDVFDHLRFWATDADEDRRNELAATWVALAAQPGAFEDVALPEDVLDWLARDWWQGLRKSIGRTKLPASFIRRIGQSVMQYLPVLHVLLGKAHRPIDLETAILATRYAEWHMTCALTVVQSYQPDVVNAVQTVVSRYDQLIDQGIAPSPREIVRRLSRAQREELGTAQVREIVDVLESIAPMPGIIDDDMGTRERSAALLSERDVEAARLRLNERKRNERRLREAMQAHRDGTAGVSGGEDTVVPFPTNGSAEARPAA